MKSLLKIIRRYSLTAGLIIFVILASNVAVFLYLGYSTMDGSEELIYGREAMECVAEELTEEGGRLRLSGQGEEMLKDTDFMWAMALDEDGQAVWDWKLPKDFKKKYSLSDVASFSRWYLKDYPVRVWKSGKYLLVFGCDKDQIVRYDALMSSALFKNFPFYVKTMITANIVLILFFVFVYGFRFYRSVKPIGEGIEKLSQGEPVELRETGLAGELAGKLNSTSKILKEQKAKLAKRDQARTEWISGVSHDIPTPLSLIVGYSDRLSEDETLSKEQRGKAEAIRRQSLIIRQLIADLNLTSRLAYDAQPLKKKMCSPAALLRECVADFYNGDLESDVVIDIFAEEEAQKVQIEVDEGLIKRALRNLIGNSIRHNPGECHVTVNLSVREERVYWLIKDSGKGIPEIVVKSMAQEDSRVHIMGLRLTAQIARAHGGELRFLQRESGSFDAEFSVYSGKNGTYYL